MKTKFVTFGEIMLRLKSQRFERLLQTPILEATFGGGEANVAVSLANYGFDAKYVTALPDNDIANACLRELRGFGVDVSDVVISDGRVGIYFLESGAVQRPSKVIYDRANSSIATVNPSSFIWAKIFEGAKWLHISGITPAISESAAEASIACVKAAKEYGVMVSCDLNFRKNLWKWGKASSEVMPEIVKYTDVIIANEEDVQKALGIASESAHEVESGELNVELYKNIAQLVLEQYPNVSKIAITLRESKSASHNDWAACIYNGKDFYISRKYSITDIVDRVGGGDSFCAGLIYGLNTYGDDKQALEYAVAASCLKHTIDGDYNRVSVKEVEALMKGSGSGRVQR
ncbi:MAG: sugar kinase [Christensenellaceae bacterium]|nr:sugar kinase [Christensenellaceae bacterium]